jgi:Zinc carboxypeptidase
MSKKIKISIERKSLPGYLTVEGIDEGMQYLANTYPSIVQIFDLPEKSHENTTIKALKIGNNDNAIVNGNKKAALFLGGVHAREIVNPDLLLSFSLDLCRAYTAQSSLKYGKASSSSFDKFDLQKVVDGLDVFIIPLVNPDGRAVVMSPVGDSMWRKNMNPNPNLPCKGVDINRNYDFLWKSNIGTSSDSCDEIFKGNAAFSEPETRNVRYMLEQHPQIQYMIDVHSFHEDILYPWGDDDDQTSKPSMNFSNPKYDDVRGFPEDEDNPNDPNDPDGPNDPDEPKETLYKEYISKSDFKWFKSTGKIISRAISGVRGTNYTVKQSVGLYPTSAASDDYSYSRHMIDTSKGKVMSYTLETGNEFQPDIKEGTSIISEVSAGLLAFCISIGGVTRRLTKSSEIISKSKIRKKNRIIATSR